MRPDTFYLACYAWSLFEIEPEHTSGAEYTGWLITPDERKYIRVPRCSKATSGIRLWNYIHDRRITTEEADFLGAIERFLEGLLTRAELSEDRLIVYLRNKIEPVSYALPSVRRQELIAGHLLRRGYLIEEVQGRSIHVITPSGARRSSYSGECDCPSYNRYGQCEHQALVEVYEAHRDLFIKAGVASITTGYRPKLKR